MPDETEVYGLTFGRVWSWWRAASLCLGAAGALFALLVVWVPVSFLTLHHSGGWFTKFVFFAFMGCAALGLMLLLVVAECYKTRAKETVGVRQMRGALLSLVLVGGLLLGSVAVSKSLGWQVAYPIPVVVLALMLRLGPLRYHPVLNTWRALWLWRHAHPPAGFPLDAPEDEVTRRR